MAFHGWRSSIVEPVVVRARPWRGTCHVGWKSAEDALRETADNWEAGDAYEGYMGRWSRPLAHAFVTWLRPADRATWLEVGCGTGALTRAVCELAEPKGGGAQTLRHLARTHPGAPLIAISPRFVAGARRDALARQLGAQAALAKPFSRGDLYAALDNLVPAGGG